MRSSVAIGCRTLPLVKSASCAPGPDTTSDGDDECPGSDQPGGDRPPPSGRKCPQRRRRRSAIAGSPRPTPDRPDRHLASRPPGHGGDERRRNSRQQAIEGQRDEGHLGRGREQVARYSCHRRCAEAAVATIGVAEHQGNRAARDRRTCPYDDQDQPGDGDDSRDVGEAWPASTKLIEGSGGKVGPQPALGQHADPESRDEVRAGRPKLRCSPYRAGSEAEPPEQGRGGTEADAHNGRRGSQPTRMVWRSPRVRLTVIAQTTTTARSIVAVLAPAATRRDPAEDGQVPTIESAQTSPSCPDQLGTGGERQSVVEPAQKPCPWGTRPTIAAAAEAHLGDLLRPSP